MNLPFSGKSKHQLVTVYFCTIITFCSLYAAQPIQPVFQQEFNLSSFQAVLFTTLMMLPLGVAPLLYGVLLERFSARLIVRSAVLILGILELAFCISNDYFMLLSIRGLQGLAIPAIITSLMSYVSFISPRDKIQSAVARYIGATIVGGFLGRFLSGVCTELFGWRVFFGILGVFLIGCFFLLRNMKKDANMNYSKPHPREIYNVLRQPCYFWLYISIFLVFFVFAGTLNFLPFALMNLESPPSETGIGSMYTGYVMGVVVSLNIQRIISWFGKETTAVLGGLVIYALGTFGFMIENYQAMFMSMFVFCTGMFIAHSILSGYVNTLSEGNKGIANGLYISFYYMGGTIGSFAPGIIYTYFGWKTFLGAFIGMIVICAFCIKTLQHHVDAEKNVSKKY